MKKYLLIIFIVFSNLAFAQKFSIRGQAVDSVNSPLPGATVMLLSAKDSSLVNFGVSDAKGFFEIKNIAVAPHILKITFVGYKTYSQEIAPQPAGTSLDLGAVNMEVARTKLDEVVIRAEQAPVVVKKDTIEFNASAFKTNKNASVEDLLKKLPGVEVDNDGNVIAQGEQVRRVMIDGKDFFGGRDPKLATKNLPADAIDKVQVLNKKSDQAVFTGIDDGQREKAINLELKEEKRHGAFGTIMAGGGTDDRYQAKASINRFSKGRQLSFLGMGNNTNEQGFSIDDYMNFTGGSSQMMGGGGRVRLTFSDDNSSGVPLNFGNRANGIMNSFAAGANINNEFNKKTELNGSYFFNYLDHNKDETTYRENFLPTGSFIYNQNSIQNNTNSNHRTNLTLDHKIDSANSLKLTSNITYNETDSEVRSTSENIDPEGTLQNESERLTLSSGATTALNANLLYRHRFAQKGRTFSANLTLGLTNSDRDGSLDATNNYYTGDEREEILKQVSTQATDYQSYGASFSYTEPLGGRKYLEGNYSYRQNLNRVDKEVYDIVNDERQKNDQLSNDYNSNYQYHRTGMNFRINRKKYSLTAGTSYQNTHLTGNLNLIDVEINKTFANLLPALHFNYDFSDTRHLAFDYETSMEEPTIQQLSPVVDNSDPLNLSVGNPELRPSYQQSWRANFNMFNPSNFISFFTFLDVDYTTKAITNAQFIDDELIRTTMPVNVKDNLSISSTATFSFPITKLKSRFNITGSWRDQRSINLLNDTENGITQQTAGGTVRYNYRYKEIFDFSLSAQLSHSTTMYEFDQPDQTYLNKTYSAESNLTFLKDFLFSANFEYLQYESKSTDFTKSIPLLGLSVSRYLLKNKSGELKFAVSNLFDRALGVNQTSSVNYIQRTTTNSLGRYFMLSFTYALNKQLNPMGMRRGGGMRIIRQ